MNENWIRCAALFALVTVLGCGDDGTTPADGGGRDGTTPGRDGAMPPRDSGMPMPDGGGPMPIVCMDDCRYVRADAPAGGDGSDWASAFAAVPDSLDRGFTYFVGDGDYGDQSFDDAEDGTTEIRIVKATAADHGTEVGWDAAYGDGQAVLGSLFFSTGHYRVDGRVGGGPGQWESGFGFRVFSGGHNIHLEGAVSGIALAHLDVENNGRYSTGHGGNEHSFYAIGGASGVSIQYSYLHDVNGVQLLTAGASNFLLELTKLARNGPTGFDGGHREAWSAMDDDDITIRWCIFEDISNTAFLGLVNGSGDAERWWIYGNVWVHTDALDDVGVSALVALRYADPHFLVAVDWEFHNNTIVGVRGLGAGLALDRAMGVRMFDNLWYDNEVNAIQLEDEHDANWFADNLRTDGCPTPCDLDPDLVASETDAELGTGDPFVDRAGGDYRLAAPTRAGRTLDAPFDRDMFGNARGADGVWDRGAIEHVAP